MTTSSTTRSIDIDAPVEEVFALVCDVQRLMRCAPASRDAVIGEVQTSSDGASATYRWTTMVAIGPLHYDVHGTTTRERLVPNQSLVYRHTMGLHTVETITVAPAMSGTRLTFAVSITSTVPLLDKLAMLIASKGRGHAHYVDVVLGEIKQEVETAAYGQQAGSTPNP